MIFNDCIPFIRFARQFKCDKSYKFDTYSYDHRLFYVLSGNGKIQIRQKEYNLTPNTAILLPSGTPYKIICIPMFQLVSINFDYTQSHSEVKNSLSPTLVTHYNPDLRLEQVDFSDAEFLNHELYIEDAYYIKKDIFQIIEEEKLQKVFFSETSSSIMRNILCKIARRLNTSSNDIEKKMNIIISYIQENYNHDITNKEIASIINYHPYYVNKLLLSYTGTTLHQYLMNYRLTIAEEKLLFTDESISSVAVNTGFNNTNYFSACFKKKYGMNPGEFRKQHKNRP